MIPIGIRVRQPLSRLLAEPWVWPPRECPFHERTVALFRDAGGAAPPRGVTADDESTLLRLVAAEAGLSLLPSFLVDEGRAKGEVVALREPQSEIALSFVWRARDERSPLLAPVIEAVRRVWEG